MSDVVSSGPPPPARPETRLTYEDALSWVMGLADFERSVQSPVHSSFHLERMRLLLERLDNPHLGIPTVHIAGTKGKGSTAAMVTSVLAAQGYRVGLYTSPHLHSAVERIRVGLEPIARPDFAALVERVWPAVEWAGREGGYGPATTFEVLTAMAFLHFKLVQADFQVIEVGLGGRLDSTNVVSPEVCVITSISLDHVAILGNTVESIAHEKAGIVKSGVPVVLAPQPDEAMRVFREVAGQRGSPLLNGDARVYWRRKAGDEEGQFFEAEGPSGRYDLWLPLLGDHQLENACTAIATLETLAARGFEVSKESVVRGLGAVKWPARLEILSRDGPLLAVDGAHNPYSALRLVQAVRDYLRFRDVYLIFGTLGGHSAGGMLAELSALSPKVLAVRSRHPRSTSSRVISELVVEQDLPLVYESDNVGEATRRAMQLAGEDDLVLGTGSLSVAAEVTEEVRGIVPELYPSIKRPPDQDNSPCA